MSKRINVGDWVFHKGVGTIYHVYFVNPSMGMLTTSCARDFKIAYCTRLPASPRELIKCWRLAEKMKDAHYYFDYGEASNWSSAEKGIYALIDKHRRSKTKRGKK